MVAGTRLLDKAMSFAIIVFLTRQPQFGQQGLGEFNYFFSLASLFAPMMDLGTGMILLQRWHERDALGRRRLMTQLIALKVAMGLLALAMCMGGDAINHWQHPNPFAVSAAFLAIFFDDFACLLRGPAHAEGKVLLETVLPLVSRVIQLVAVLLFIGRITSGFQVLYIYAAANGVELLASIYGAKGCPPVSLKSLRNSDWWELIKNGAPFAMSALFVMASLHFDSVLLGRYSYKDVGAYTAATRIIMVLNVLNGGICHALFPKIIKAKANNEPGHTGWLINGTLRGFTILFGSISIGGAVVAQRLMPALYGAEFTSSGPIFALLSPLILLSAIYSLLGQTLEILGQQAKVMRLYAISAILNVAGNLILIPYFGMYGSAVATLLSTLLTCILLMFAILKNEHIRMSFGGMERAVLFLAVLTLFYIPLAWMNVWVALPLGGVIFAVLMLSFRRYWLAGMGRIAEPFTSWRQRRAAP
jgi:O-antigen/teichoic acid export membrane protein